MERKESEWKARSWKRSKSGRTDLSLRNASLEDLDDLLGFLSVGFK